MSTDLSPRDSQDLRHAVLQVLSTRAKIVPLTLESICCATRRLVPFTIHAIHVAEAVEFHVSMEHCEKIVDPFGSEETWKVTAKGILVHERDPNKVG